MTRPHEIEFLDGGDVTPLAEEEIGSASRVPRWVVGTGIVAVLAVLAGAVAAHHGRAAHRAAVAPSTSAAPPPLVAGPARAAAPADALSLPGATAAIDIAVVADRLYVLQADRITVLDSRSSALIRSYPFELGAPTENQRLVADGANARMWVVQVGGQTTSVLDAITFDSIATVNVPATIQRAVVLDGLLFVATNRGVYSVDGASAARIYAADQPVAIAADPSRHRLLVLVSGRPSTVLALSESGHVLARAQIDVTGGDLTTVGSAVWLTGTDADGAEVRTLDTVTLRPGPNDDIARQLTPGARIAGSGTASLWLRSTGTNRDVLWCHDAQGGPPASWWTLAGRVASDRNAAFVVDSGTVRPVNLFTGCTG